MKLRTIQQLTALKAVYNLSKGNIAIPVSLITICNELKSSDKVVVSGDLRYLEDNGYLNHTGFIYHLTSSGLRYIADLP
jgi:hypothetical protein